MSQSSQKDAPSVPRVERPRGHATHAVNPVVNAYLPIHPSNQAKENGINHWINRANIWSHVDVIVMQIEHRYMMCELTTADMSNRAESTLTTQCT
jgi:hypothetical protein